MECLVQMCHVLDSRHFMSWTQDILHAKALKGFLGGKKISQSPETYSRGVPTAEAMLILHPVSSPCVITSGRFCLDFLPPPRVGGDCSHFVDDVSHRVSGSRLGFYQVSFVGVALDRGKGDK